MAAIPAQTHRHLSGFPQPSRHSANLDDPALIDPQRSCTIWRNRHDLAHLIRMDRRRYYQALLAQPDPQAPDTLGCVWHGDADNGRLRSPAVGTIWWTPELRAEEWDTGYAGIHAARRPRDWRRARLADHRELNGYHRPSAIIGVVERFGKYVLSTEGWRAEIV
jgi:hypothetical protein